MRELNVFMVDDHSFVLEGYKSILKMLLSENNFKITEAKDCKTSLEAIENTSSPFDLAFIDWSIPKFEKENLHSGEDVALLIRKNMPNCKIIVITSFSELLFIKKVFNTLNPDGFMIKSESSPPDFVDCVRTVLNDNHFYSKTVSEYVQRPISYYQLDHTDLIILQKLSKGVKTVNLTEYLDLSLSGIEKRKTRIKFKLDVSGNDEKLLETARNLGLV